MRPDPLSRFRRFLGVVLLITVYCSMAHLRNAEAVTSESGIPAEAKFSCMISKSAYGSPGLDEPVRMLRQFRDRVLKGTAVGRWVVKAYYRVSASIAPSLEGDGLSGSALRLSTRGFLYVVKYIEAIGLGIGAVLIAFALGRGAIRGLRRPGRNGWGG
jgi:hypothetical protein